VPALELEDGERAGKNGTHLTMSVPVKDVYVYPLAKGFREVLCT
jgi:hypothetical protein